MTDFPTIAKSAYRKAFSLGEVLIASFVLTSGIFAVLVLINASYKNSSESQNLIVASELAQEGVELARNIRDNAIATGSTGDLVFRSFPTGSGSKCIIDYTFPIPAGATSINCGSPNYQLYLNANKIYTYTSAGNTATNFYRAYRIDHTGGSNQARVQSFVAWQDPGANFNPNNLIGWCTLGNKCVYTELLLTAWK